MLKTVFDQSNIDHLNISEKLFAHALLLQKILTTSDKGEKEKGGRDEAHPILLCYICAMVYKSFIHV